jgi:hypothetical protein
VPEPPPIADEEILLRHIPGDPNYLAPGPRITSYNFALRRGQAGISVTRAGMTTPRQLLARVLSGPESRVAAVTAAEVRALGLDTVPVPLPDDPGHAEIRSSTADLNRRNVRQRLADVFRLLDHPETSP